MNCIPVVFRLTVIVHSDLTLKLNWSDIFTYWQSELEKCVRLSVAWCKVVCFFLRRQSQNHYANQPTDKLVRNKVDVLWSSATAAHEKYGWTLTQEPYAHYGVSFFTGGLRVVTVTTFCYRQQYAKSPTQVRLCEVWLLSLVGNSGVGIRRSALPFFLKPKFVRGGGVTLGWLLTDSIWIGFFGGMFTRAHCRYVAVFCFVVEVTYTVALWAWIRAAQKLILNFRNELACWGALSSNQISNYISVVIFINWIRCHICRFIVTLWEISSRMLLRLSPVIGRVACMELMNAFRVLVGETERKGPGLRLWAAPRWESNLKETGVKMSDGFAWFTTRLNDCVLQARLRVWGFH